MWTDHLFLFIAQPWSCRAATFWNTVWFLLTPATLELILVQTEAKTTVLSQFRAFIDDDAKVISVVQWMKYRRRTDCRCPHNYNVLRLTIAINCTPSLKNKYTIKSSNNCSIHRICRSAQTGKFKKHILATNKNITLNDFFIGLIFTLFYFLREWLAFRELSFQNPKCIDI